MLDISINVKKFGDILDVGKYIPVIGFICEGINDVKDFV